MCVCVCVCILCLFFNTVSADALAHVVPGSSEDIILTLSPIIAFHLLNFVTIIAFHLCFVFTTLLPMFHKQSTYAAYVEITVEISYKCPSNKRS